MAQEPQQTTPPTGGQSDIEENKLIAFIGYFWLLCLVPLLAKKDSPYAQFHGKQGLALAIAVTIWWVASWILGLIPVLGWIIIVLGNIVLFVLWLIGIINALSGKTNKLPIIGDLAEKIKI